MKLGEHGTWRSHKALLIVISLVVFVGFPLCLYLARRQIVAVVGFRRFGARFEWDRAGGLKTFTMRSPFHGATGEKLWVYLVTAQVKPILDRKLRQGPWQKATGEVWLKVAGVIPLVWPDDWGPYYENPNGFFVDNYTPLMLAVDHGNIDSVRKLLAAGADVNAKDVFGRTALAYACSSGRASDDVIELLLSAGADPNAADKAGVAPLYSAAITRWPPVLQRLLHAGAKVNAIDKWGRTALMPAAGLGAADGMQVLLAAGADVNMQDDGGKTALMFAARAGHLDALRVLLAAGADVDMQGEGGETALMDAAGAERLDALRVLLAAGAGVNIRDRSGDTALSLAERKGCLKAAGLLKAAGAKR